jgi:WD40 repeat protein/serine/threonine protein kinase
VDSSAPLLSSNAWTPGVVLLGLYEVIGLAGKGGMGTVYRVRHCVWGIDLAVKCPQPEVLALAGGADAFEREAETWVNLGLHPHVASCYYVRRIEGVPHVFAEFVEGGSLADWIRAGRLSAGGPEQSLNRILDIAIQFAWGLQHAHEAGLVHQDVKPHNVLMTPEGVAKVTDFGLAKGQRIVASHTPEMLGASVLVSCGGLTPAYCSPEQVERRPLSRKTDVWSWAVSVLEMFTGEVQWKGGWAAGQALESYLATQTPDARPRMPVRVAELLRRCFRADPAERPADMREIANTLNDAYQEWTQTAYPRRPPQMGAAAADSLNNRAVSLLDLGKEKEAQEVWEGALAAEALHPEANYNLGLLRWRRGRITDEAVVRQMTAVCGAHPGKWTPAYLLAHLHLESGDDEAALTLLRSLSEEDAGREEVRALRARAVQRLVGFAPLPRWNAGGAIAGVYLAVDGSEALCVVIQRDADHETARESVLPSPRLVVDGTEPALRPYGFSYFARRWNLASGKSLDTEGRANDGAHWCGLCLEGRFTLTQSGIKELRLTDIVANQVLSTFPLAELPNEIDRRPCLARAVLMERLLQQNLDPDPGPYQGYGDRVAPCAALSGDGCVALLGSSLGKLTVVDAVQGKPLRTLQGHTGPAIAVCSSTDGAVALSGGTDSTLRLWDVATGRCLRTIAAPMPITAVALSADARFALAATSDGTVRLWHVGCHEKPWIAPVVLCGVVASETVLEYERHLQEARTATARNDFPLAAEHLRRARTRPGCARRPEVLRAWQGLYPHLRREAFRGVWEEMVLGGDGVSVSALAVSPDGRRAVAGSGPGPVLIWDLEAGGLAGLLPATGRFVKTVTFCADGRRVILGTADRTLELWDLATERLLKSFVGHKGWVSSVSLDAGGKLLLSASSDGMLLLWEIASGRRKRSFAARAEVHAAALSADATLVAGGTAAGEVCVWEADRRRLVRRFRAHEGTVHTLSFSRDGRRLLSGGADRAVRLWDVHGSGVRTLRGHTNAVTSVCLSEDERYALSGSEDHTLRLWDLESGSCVHAFLGHTGAVRTALFGPDGRFALSADRDGKIRLWRLDWELTEPAREVRGTPGKGDLLELPLSGLSMGDGRLRKWSMSGAAAAEHELREIRKVRLRQQRNRPAVGRWVLAFGLLLSVIGLRYLPDIPKFVRQLIPNELGISIAVLILVSFLSVWLIASGLAWLFASERHLFLEVILPHDVVRYRVHDSPARCRAFVRQLRRRIADKH